MKYKKSVSSHPTKYMGPTVRKPFAIPSQLISSPHSSFNSVEKVLASSQHFKKAQKEYVRAVNRTLDTDVDEISKKHVNPSLRSTMVPFAYNNRRPE